MQQTSMFTPAVLPQPTRWRIARPMVTASCGFTEDVADTSPRSFINELTFKSAWNFGYANRDALLWPQGTLAISKGVWQALALHGPMAAISFSLRKLLGLRV